MNAWHIAQLNVGRTVAPSDSPELGDFMAALDRINALAESLPGFVWRLQSSSGNATDILVSEDPRFLVNMSVWSSVDSLFAFVYRSGHTDVMKRRREHLRREGPTERAFGFSRRYPPPGESGSPEDMKPEPYCGAWNSAVLGGV